MLYEQFKKSKKLVKTVIVIHEYLSSKGYKWFTYRGLRYFVDKKHYEDLEWHTVERYIRKMVELGLLERREYTRRDGRKAVGFYPTSLFYKLVDELRELGMVK